ncbi:uncharacterized protein [Typha latifolia]|uniref:uncharacterized protein n=1 Tax=Typha latifolia TaxID=4733 RepID=UPI003C2EC0B0
MSPAAKSKSKDRSAAKAVTKEQPKIALKPSSIPANVGSGAPASAYNPVSGTFHTFETTPVSSLATQNTGRFRSIDETEEHSGSSLGTAGEFDCASNNDSCSGESEDQKEKTSSTGPQVESVPGSDTDKRDKIRQKNERKHQRQKEKRAQELHDRCRGYLMSRKLEALSQQLVAMGFTSEQATMALIQNEGRLEEAVAWLFESGEDNKQQVVQNVPSGVNLKIDIADEIAKIVDMEFRFKCTKQEVERAVVATEGDLIKAEEALKALKQEQAATLPKLEESGDPGSFNNKVVATAENPTARAHVKATVSIGTQHQRREERDFDYKKSSPNGTASQDLGNKNTQALRREPLKPDLGRQQVTGTLEQRRSSGSSTPMVSESLLSPLAAHLMKPEAQHVVTGSEVKTNMQPIVVMQRPQSINAKQNLPSTSHSFSASPPSSTGWYLNGISSYEAKRRIGTLPNFPNLGLNSSTVAHKLVPQSHFQTIVSNPIEPAATRWGGSWPSAGNPLSSLAAPSSLGLFTQRGSSGLSVSSPVDWNSSGLMPFDYTSIDWSLDLTLLKPSMNRDLLCDTWSTMFMGGKTASPAVSGGVRVPGLQDGSSSFGTDSSSLAGSHEWTSPFTAKDLLRASRKFVTSPVRKGVLE